MGAVYEVVNERLCREAAVKVLMPYVARQHEHFSLRFERECRLASAIKHPNLVEILEYGFERARGLHYMVMELVRGSSLSEKLLNGPFEEAEALRVVRGVARALSAIGRNGVVHRDVKPGNILLGPEGVVKLTDLGLAKSLADEQGITGSFATLGSMHYMSPEQVTDARKVDPRADLFSLGSTLYAMLTGHSPFEGGNLYKVSERIVREPHVDPRVLRPEIGPRTVAVLDRLLAKNPEDRFPDGDGVLEALDEAP